MTSEKTWGVGSHIWMILMILLQWLMPIEFWTKPITATNAAYQTAAIVYTIAAVVMTALFIWLWVSKSKVALRVYLVLAAVSAVISIAHSGLGSAVLSLIFPVLTYIILRSRVE